MRTCTTCLLLFLMAGLSSPSVHAQFFSWGQDPASIRWKQIHTAHFHLLFPCSYEEQAKDIAHLLEQAYGRVSESLGHQPRKVSVVIHNQTVVSNGFVSWAPARMELFTNPPPDNDAHHWMERLAIHEFRHVVQVDQLNRGLLGLLSSLFGEWVTGASVGLFMPLWLLEGDAVAAETAFTPAGRGRLPVFEQGLRAQLLERGHYTYEKALFGSFRDHVPNHYELGYQLVAATREEHGADIWGRVMSHVGRRPYSLFPVSLGLKHHTGRYEPGHYRHLMEALREAWSKQAKQHRYTPHEPLPLADEPKIYTQYAQPWLLSDSSLLAVKTSLDDIPAVVEIGLDGAEKRLFRPGMYTAHGFSAGGGRIAWSERRHDPRWEHRSWSDIHVFDLEKGTKRRLTKGTRLFSPALSFCGSRIAAVEVTETDDFFLVLLDVTHATEQQRLKLADGAFPMAPSWSPCGSWVVFVAQGDRGKRIDRLHVETLEVNTLFQAGYTEISRPRFAADSLILFNGAFSGTDQVYALHVLSKEVSQWISSRYGAVDALSLPGREEYVWAEYTVDGYRLVRGRPDTDQVLPLEQVKDHSLNRADMLAAQEGGVIRPDRAGKEALEVTPYSKLAHLFRFHSWAPLSLNIDRQTAQPGVSVFSQNALSTSFLSMGYAYDLNEELGRFYVDYSYLGLYPAMDLHLGTGLRRATYREEEELVPFLWRENVIKWGMHLPLSWSRGAFHYGLIPQWRAGITQAAPSGDSPDFLLLNQVNTLEYRLLAYSQQRMAVRDLRPRLGFITEWNFRHTPLGGTSMGRTFSGRITGFVPGFFRHHSLRLGAAFQLFEGGEQKEQAINFRFPVVIAYPRGISGRTDDRLLSLGVDYAFPLAYPEWRLPAIFYLKRLHANLFLDHAFTSREVQRPREATRTEKEELTTAGIDLIGHWHFFRFYAPVELGIRGVYDLREGQTGFRLLFSVGFY